VFLVRNTAAYSCLKTYRLQSVQNATARLIFGIRRSKHITDALISFHWLRVRERILFKNAVTTYRAVKGSAPAYLSSYFTRVADVPSRQRLRSTSTTNHLAVLLFNLSTVGKRAFPVSGANFWNSLPSRVTSAPLQTLRDISLPFVVVVILVISSAIGLLLSTVDLALAFVI